MRIFRTQEEINFFQRNIDGLDAADSFKQNRLIVEPLKETAYEAVTHKNTHFKPESDEISRSELDNSQPIS